MKPDRRHALDQCQTLDDMLRWANGDEDALLGAYQMILGLGMVTRRVDVLGWLKKIKLIYPLTRYIIYGIIDL